MNNLLVTKLFDEKIEEELTKILSSDFSTFKKSKIKLIDDTYYFIKVNEISFIFCSLVYNLYTDKGYLQPIAIINNNSDCLLFPTFYEFYYENYYESEIIDIKYNSKEERLICIVSSLEVIDLIYENKKQIISGNNMFVKIDDVEFTISDLFNSSFNFHINNGQTHIAKYEYELCEITNELSIGKIEFIGDYYEKFKFFDERKMIVSNNEVEF